MNATDAVLRELVLRLLPADGGGIGNKAMLKKLAQEADFRVTPEDYRRCGSTAAGHASKTSSTTP
jgi:hypothetical protein